MNHDTRPVNLDLTKFEFPITALASITHRVAGVILFAGIAFLLFGLEKSLSSAAGFDEFLTIMQSPVAKFIAWGLLSGLIYHFVAGIKHLLLDLEIADTLEGSRLAAKLVILVSSILILLAGVWIFQ